MNWFFCSRWLDAAPWAPIIVSGQGSPSAAASRVLLCNRPTQHHSFGEIQSRIRFSLMACWSCECSPLSLMATLFWDKFPKFFLRCTGFLRLWQQWWSWSALGPDAIEGEGVAAPDSLTMPVFVRTWQQEVSWVIVRGWLATVDHAALI